MYKLVVNNLPLEKSGLIYYSNEALVAIREDNEPIELVGNEFLRKNIIAQIEQREYPVTIYSTKTKKDLDRNLWIIQEEKEFQIKPYTIIKKVWEDLMDGFVNIPEIETTIARIFTSSDQGFIYLTRGLAKNALLYLNGRNKEEFLKIYQISIAGLLNKVSGTKNWRDIFIWLEQKSIQDQRCFLKLLSKKKS